ncbi:MAG: hypothetical protein ACO1TE_14450 [Prosthecobacter sp.]
MFHEAVDTLKSLPGIKDQRSYNLDRWDEIGRDPLVRTWPGKVETDRNGRLVMISYAEFEHGEKQASVAMLLDCHSPAGKVAVECPISTSEGIKVADAIWVSKKRLVQIGGRTALKGAPEICVEVISP